MGVIDLEALHAALLAAPESVRAIAAHAEEKGYDVISYKSTPAAIYKCSVRACDGSHLFVLDLQPRVADYHVELLATIQRFPCW